MPYLSQGSSTITLTYAASTRFVPSYGIMSMAKAALECWTRELACHLGPHGHRVNSISSGPIRTIAAQGIPGFDRILDHVEANAPLRRNVNQSDVAHTNLVVIRNHESVLPIHVNMYNSWPHVCFTVTFTTSPSILTQPRKDWLPT